MLQTTVSNFIYFTLIDILIYYSAVNFDEKLCDFLTVEWFRYILITFIVFFSPPWRWSCEWPNHVGDHNTIKLHPPKSIFWLVFLIYVLFSSSIFTVLWHFGVAYKFLFGVCMILWEGRVLYSYNNLTECGIPMKLIRLIKWRVNETYTRVRVGERLSGMFLIKNGLKQEMLYRHCFSTLL